MALHICWCMSRAQSSFLLLHATEQKVTRHGLMGSLHVMREEMFFPTCFLIEKNEPLILNVLDESSKNI